MTASLPTKPTSPYLIAAQSPTQSAALRRGAPSLPVCLGGPAAARRQCDAAAGVLSVGLATGLRQGLHTGDVIVATEIHGRDGTYCCPSAPMLATVLRRRGLTVHTGPVATMAQSPTGAERAQLVAAGAWCVDGESAWPPTEAGMPVAAVRVIADSGANALPRPLTLARQQAALRVLSQIAPDLQSWGHAVRTDSARQVLLAGPRSFCAGVVRAVDIVTRALAQRGAPVYVRKQIVHNVHVVADLQRQGAVFVDDLEDIPDGACVVFSAHGVSPAVRAEAGARGLEVIDATCPLVSKVHTEVRRFVDRGDTVIFIGHRGHEETVGTMGERPAATVLVQDTEDAQSVQVPDPRRVTYLVQTTLAADDVAAIIAVLRRRFSRLRAPATEDICYATTNRQAALEAVAAEADLTLVIGSDNSSNSLRLVEKSRRLGTEAHLIDDAGDIDLAWLAGTATVALTAGASAPTILVDGVTEALRGLGPVEVHERAITTENIHFTLPKEVRAP